MEKKQAILEIKTKTATYTLPAEQIDIDNVSDMLGENVDLEDIDVEIKKFKAYVEEQLQFLKE